jgi:hypothetical protein
MSIDIRGPFQPARKVTINDYVVPFVTVALADDGMIDVIVDDRLGMAGPVSREEFDRWMPVLANAMAVAAGYSSHGESCEPLNRHKQKMTSLSLATPKLAIVPNRTET